MESFNFSEEFCVYPTELIWRKQCFASPQWFLVVLISIVCVNNFAASSAVISSQHAPMENYNLRVPTSKDTNFHNIWCSNIISNMEKSHNEEFYS